MLVGFVENYKKKFYIYYLAGYPLSGQISVRYNPEDNIVSPFPFFIIIFFLTAMIFPSPLHNFIFFSYTLDRELYTPLGPANCFKWSIMT